MQIFILGAHRSGTSALTRLVNMMGAYVGAEGSTIGYNDENPKGFWERRDVIELNEALLAHYDCRWDDLYHWPAHEALCAAVLPEALGDRIRSLVLELDHHRPWAMKDPRLCQTFALWRPFLEMPMAIIAWRNPYEVAMSLHRRNGFSLLHGLALWEYAMHGAIFASEGLPRMVVSYQHMMQHPAAFVARLYAGAQAAHVQGLRLPDEQEIHRFIDPSLYRSRTDDVAGLPALSKNQQALLQWLERASQDEATIGASLSELSVPELSVESREVMALVHGQRVSAEALEQAQQSLTEQSGRSQALEQQLQQAQAALHTWHLSQHDWLHQCDRITALEMRLQEEAARLDHRLDLLGDPGRIRRRISKLLAFLGG